MERFILHLTITLITIISIFTITYVPNKKDEKSKAASAVVINNLTENNEDESLNLVEEENSVSVPQEEVGQEEVGQEEIQDQLDVVTSDDKQSETVTNSNTDNQTNRQSISDINPSIEENNNAEEVIVDESEKLSGDVAEENDVKEEDVNSDEDHSNETNTDVEEEETTIVEDENDVPIVDENTDDNLTEEVENIYVNINTDPIVVTKDDYQIYHTLVIDTNYDGEVNLIVEGLPNSLVFDELTMTISGTLTKEEYDNLDKYNVQVTVITPDFSQSTMLSFFKELIFEIVGENEENN